MPSSCNSPVRLSQNRLGNVLASKTLHPQTSLKSLQRNSPTSPECVPGGHSALSLTDPHALHSPLHILGFSIPCEFSLITHDPRRRYAHAFRRYTARLPRQYARILVPRSQSGNGKLIIPLCSMPPKFLKLLKRGHENASRGSLANPPLASICA